jgi:hypothetical protein
LEMKNIHSRQTAHWLAEMVFALDPTAKNLEKILGWNAAACLAVPIPKFTRLFYSSNEEVISFLQEVQATKGECLR